MILVTCVSWMGKVCGMRLGEGVKKMGEVHLTDEAQKGPHGLLRLRHNSTAPISLWLRQ